MVRDSVKHFFQKFFTEVKMAMRSLRARSVPAQWSGTEAPGPRFIRPFGGRQDSVDISSFALSVGPPGQSRRMIADGRFDSARWQQTALSTNALFAELRR
ncbi:hypothetical protein AB7849_13665 [Rhodanobacter sp. 115]|uniref:hypothetical protein n=1 Tax=Rhodanobacter sp. FW021-MT20 TaxID=1162282 RepID=UPI0012F734C8|nr:hypothetical protein [Rhodanobacter sp. 115]